MTRQISLSVNDSPIEMDYFVQGFIDHTVYGMASGLEGVSDIRDIEIEINGNDTAITVNGDSVPLNDFVATIVGNTVRGMVSSPVKVRTRGGEELVIYFEGEGDLFDRVWLEGNTSIVYTAHLHKEAL